MRHRENYVGNRYGKLVALSEASPKFRKDRGTAIRRMLCRCDCGNTAVATVPDLKSGNTLSCGCWKVEATKRFRTTHGASISVDRGRKATTEYNIWRGMIDRCENQNHISYEWYGGRGIKVCDRWRLSFEAFYEDMGARPSLDHSIDRVDGDGDYCRENCRWATGQEQFQNLRVSPEFRNNIKRKKND